MAQPFWKKSLKLPYKGKQTLSISQQFTPRYLGRMKMYVHIKTCTPVCNHSLIHYGPKLKTNQMSVTDE